VIVCVHLGVLILEIKDWVFIIEADRERAFSYLTDAHLDRIAGAYHAFAGVEGFARVVTIDEVLRHDANLNIPLYIRQQNGTNGTEQSLPQVIGLWGS